MASSGMASSLRPPSSPSSLSHRRPITLQAPQPPQPPPPSSPTRTVTSVANSSREDRHRRLIAASGQANEAGVRAVLAEEAHWHTVPDQNALRESLQKVVARGNVSIARMLLAAGADVEPRGDSEIAALYKAAEMGHREIVAMLLQHHADPNTPVHARFDQTALFAASWRGHDAIVELLLDHKADANAVDRERRSPLLYLVSETKSVKWTSKTLALLVGRGGAKIDVRDTTGRTPLLWAVTHGNQKLAEMLLDGSLGARADVKAANNRGRSALHLAAEDNLVGMVKLLLDKGARPNAISDGGWTALHNAAQNGHDKVVALLLAVHADVNAELSNGMTPLHWAAFNGHETVVGQLLAHDATILDLKDSFDRTPLLCAAERFHGDIVRMLSPERTAHRLSEAALGACKAWNATVVDFGNFRDNKKHLVMRPSVYDVLYGLDKDPERPRDEGHARVTTQVDKIKYKPEFRWIHLPANNASGFADVEHFKSLERCFYQEHRGPLAHANYMRTFCDRFPDFQGNGAHVSGRDERRFPPVAEESDTSSNTASNLGSLASNLAAPGPGEGGATTPTTPRKSSFADTGEREGPKKKGKGEQIAERHPKRGGRTRGPPGNPPGTKAQKQALRSLNSSSLLETSQLPDLNGKIVLFMPYLHYETDEQRQRMSQAIKLVRQGGDPTSLGPPRDVMLAKGYLCQTPPLHPRRTLDQFFYRGIDTSLRDTDQVVYRYCKRHNLEKKVFMVDQLWLWILGKDLVITCFPQRWDQPSRDPFNVIDGVIEETNAKTRPPLQSVYDLAMLVTSRCAGMFDRHRLSDQDYQFLDMFESSIGLVTNTESELFSRFNKASEMSAQWLNQNRSAARQHDLASLVSAPASSSSSSSSSSTTLDGDKTANGHHTDTSSTAIFPDALLDIGTETSLLAEIKDIRDELNILNVLLSAQKSTLEKFESKITEELAGASGSGHGSGNSNGLSPHHFAKTIAAEIRRRSGDQLRLLETHCHDIDRMDKQAENIYVSLTNLLDLKQKHSNALEARFARDHAMIAARQGQTVLTFTIVTILFLPMSFIASFFSINFRDLEDQLYVGYVSKYTFGIGLGISIPLIIMAFTARDIYDAAHGVLAAVQRSGYLLSLASPSRRAAAKTRSARPATSGTVGGGTVAAVTLDDDYPSKHHAHAHPRYSLNHSRYDARHSLDGVGDTYSAQGRTSLTLRPPPHSSLPQHQMLNPPTWALTAGNSAMRIRAGSVAAPAPASSRNHSVSSSAGAGRGWISRDRVADVEKA